MEAGHIWHPAPDTRWYDEFEGQDLAIHRVDDELSPAFTYAWVALLRDTRDPETGAWRPLSMLEGRIVEIPKRLLEDHSTTQRELGWIG